MSTITGGHTTKLSPDATRTAIDAVMWEEFDRDEQPDVLTSRNGMFFNITGTNTKAFIWDEDSNVGAFNVTEEQEVITTDDTFIGNQTTKETTKFMKRIPVSTEAFLTDQVGKRDRIGQQIGDRGRLTQDKRAILDTYGDAFDGVTNTTPDGDTWASNSHTSLKGFTIDNLETGSLTPDNLFTQVTSLTTQLGQDGELGSHVFTGIFVPTNLYKTVKEVMDSTLIANSAENNINIFDTVYGTVAIKHSPFLTSGFNTATNAATSYHLISRNHQNMRLVLEDMHTDLIEPRYSDTDSWEYRARYQESTFPGTWTGYVGSNGTT